MTNEQMALDYYKSAFERKRPNYVPARVLLHRRVTADSPFYGNFWAGPGEMDCQCNQWGAVSVVAFNGKRLGVKPTEFDVVQWTENPK